MPTPWDAIAGGVGAITNLVSQIGARKHARKQQREQNAYNLDMWNRQNVYNAPDQQMKRLKEAGLNPNLVYGGGAQGAAGMAQPAPKSVGLDEAGYRPIDFSGVAQGLGMFTDFRGKNLSNQNAEQDLANKRATEQATNAEILKKFAGIDLTKSKTIEQKIRNSKLNNLLDTTIDGMKANAENSRSSAEVRKKEYELHKIATANSWRTASAQIEQMSANTSLTKKNIEKLQYEVPIWKLNKLFAEKYNIRPNDSYDSMLFMGFLESLSETLNTDINQDDGFMIKLLKQWGGESLKQLLQMWTKKK